VCVRNEITWRREHTAIVVALRSQDKLSYGDDRDPCSRQRGNNRSQSTVC
jgi:hypothetical protein